MNRLSRIRCILSGLCLLGLATLAAGESIPAPQSAPTPASRPTDGPLRVHPANPRYFADAAGRVVYLTGAHTWPSLVDMGPGNPPPPFDFERYLDSLVAHHHNFIRLWTWEQFEWHTRDNKENRHHRVGPQPYLRAGPQAALDGQPRFDLTRYDPVYFRRLRERVQAAGRRGIYVSVMLFEGCALQFSADVWKSHPYHPGNNINGIDGDADGNGWGLEVHELRSPAVTRLQEAYVRHVLETVGDCDNVLYEISNENHPASTEWQYHMIRYVREQERQHGRRHPIGMTFQYKGGSNRTLFESPADWISPNPKGGYREDPPVSDGTKVILNDTDHLWGMGGNRAWVWKSFLRGLNPIFMDPYDGAVLGKNEPRWELIRRALGDTRRFAERVDLAAMAPHPELASSGYCLASPTAHRPEYLVYIPKGGASALDLTQADGAMAIEWFNPDTGETRQGEPVAGGSKHELRAPFDEAVLYVFPAGRIGDRR